MLDRRACLVRLHLYMNLTLFRKTSYTTSLPLVREPGPKARSVVRHITGECALSRAQMVQQPTVFKFFDIMEKVLLEQG